MDGFAEGMAAFFGSIALFCSWVNIILIAASLGMMLLGKRSERDMLSGIAAIALILFFIQGDDLVFAGGLVSSIVGLAATGLFFSLMLERKSNAFYNIVRATAFFLLIPVNLVNLLVFGVWVFVLLGPLWV